MQAMTTSPTQTGRLRWGNPISKCAVIGPTIFVEIGCGDHLVFQKLLKINTSQAYATLCPHKKYGDDIFITFPLIDRTSSK